MEWVPLTGYDNGMDLNDRPRALDQEEIVTIVEQLPLAPSADPDAAEVSRQGTVEWLIEMLKDILIAPSAIPELIKRIVDQHNKSLVIPGTPIGITAAEAVGATTTQMTLNSVAPWEKLFIQEADGTGRIVEIGQWIDSLLLSNPTKIILIPENRTQYLELDSPVTIVSCNSDCEVIWDKITAVTKHLPVGNLVKVKTNSGREVTVTQNKSLLVWNGYRLMDTNGRDAKIGDLVPIFSQIPDPVIVFSELNGIKLDYNKGREFGNYLNSNGNSELSELVVDNVMSPNILLTNKEFLSGFIETVEYKDHLSEYIQFIRSRLGMPPLNMKGLSITANIHNDIILDEIVRIDFVEATEYVYDLTTLSTRNFSSFNGKFLADSFHTSGSSKSASFGIDAMRDIIFARKNPKNESCTIFFKDQTITYEQVLNSRQYIVGSMVSDFIKDYDIDDPNNFPQYWWHESAQLLFDKPLPNSTQVLRLYLNTSEMFKHKVSISDLATVLQREVPPSAIAIYGPIGDGIIDLYPYPNLIKETLRGKEKDTNKKEEISDDFAEITYLETIVRPELSNIRVKGISGIKRLFPRVSPVWSMVILERKVTPADITNPELAQVLNTTTTWILFYNLNVMRTTGLVRGNLASLCNAAGLTVIGRVLQGTRDDRLYISMPNDRFRTSSDEIVIDINRVKYRQIDQSAIIVFGNVVYEKIDPKKIKIPNSQGRDFYSVEIEPEQKKPPNSARWIEEIVPATIIDIPETEIRQIGSDYYRQITNLYEINALASEVTGQLVVKDDILYEEIPEIIAFNTQLKDTYTVRLSGNNAVVEIPEKDVIVVPNTTEIPQGELIPERLSYYRRVHVLYQLITNPLVKIREMKPSEYVAYRVSVSKREYKDEINRLTSERLVKAQLLPVDQRKAVIRAPVIVDRPLIMKAAEFVIADTEGSNLKELLSLAPIDKKRTTCNNMYTITNTLGIEAARTFIIRALYNTISNTGSYVHPANIMFIAEFITSRGEPYGATYTGISRQPGGHLSLATLERAGKVFTQNALHGRKEDIRNVSASVAVGARMAIGDGTFDIAQDITENGQVVTLMNDDLFMAHTRDDNTKYETQKPKYGDGADISATIDALDNMFDDTAENEARPFEVNYDLPKVIIEPIKQRKVVYRVQSETPSVLADVNEFIKTGYPVNEVEKITIKAVEKRIEAPRQVVQPIVSQGLIPFSELIPAMVDTGFPVELDDLFKQYMLEGEERLEYFPEIRLPQLEIPQISGEGVNFARDVLDVRREEIRELEVPKK